MPGKSLFDSYRVLKCSLALQFNQIGEIYGV